MEKAPLKKRILLLVAALAILVLALLCLQYIRALTLTESETSEYYSYHYAFITDGSDSDVWDIIYEAALEEGKAQGVYVEYFGKNLTTSYSRNELLQLAINAGVDGIITVGDEEEETIELINAAVEAGIPVVTVLQDSSGSLRQCFVGYNNYNLGQEYGEQILDYYYSLVATVDPAEVDIDEAEEQEPLSLSVIVLVDDNVEDVSQNLVILGIRDAIEDAGVSSITVDVSTVDNSSDFGPEESIRDIFISSETLPEVMVCLSDVYTQCVYQAVVDYNSVGDVYILGYYSSDTILEAIQKEIIQSTITFDSSHMGQLCVEALVEYMDTGYTNTYQVVDIYLITEAEVSELLEEE